MNIFARLTKVDVARREVWGRAVSEEIDKSGEVFDYEGSKPYFKAWSDEYAKLTDGASVGNLRAMHNKVAAGKLIAIDFNDADKAVDIGTKVVDDAEWTKVLEAVYTGFSIGGDYVGDKVAVKIGDAEVKRYIAKPSEISLVDNPCGPTARFFDVYKADGVVEKVAFKAMTKEYVANELFNAVAATVTGEVTAKAVSSTLDGANKQADDDPALDVTGSTEEVAEFAKLLNDGKLTMKDALAAIMGVIAKRAPDAAPAKLVFDKGMWNVQAFAECLECLAGIAMSAESDAQYEGDASPIPAALREWVATGVKIFQDMSTEESGELVASMAEHAGDDFALMHAVRGARAAMKSVPPADAPLGALLKACADAMDADEFAKVVMFDAPALRAALVAKQGARHSAADKAHLQNAHNSMVALGAECASGDKLAPNAELVKGDTLAKQVETLTAEVAVLKKQPLPQRVRLRTVEKAHDIDTPPGAPEAVTMEQFLKDAVRNSDGTINEPATLIKYSQATGGVPYDPRLRAK